jgi:tetratricopeptide (TPR) repeat protein
LAHVHYSLGQAYLLTGDSQLARESFERAMALYPDMVEPNLALAILESQSGQFQRARVRLNEILKSHPNHIPTMERLFALDLGAGDWNHARATLESLRQVVGDTAVTMMAEGRLKEAQKDFARATVAFERAAAMTPEAREPLLAVVRLDLDQKQPDHARRRLETVVAANPAHPYAHGLLGEVLSIVGRHDAATAQFREATRINPTWVLPWINWATLSLSQGQADSAIRTLREGLVVNSTSEELQMLLASVLANQGSVDEAIGAYDAVLRMNPRNVLSANNLAALLADFKADAPHLERAFLLSRDFEKEAPHPLFLDTLGWVRLKMGHLDDAVRLMRQAIAKAPDLPMLNYHLGAALYQSGQNVEAKVHLVKALKSTEQFQGRREAQQLLARTSG